MLGSSLISWKSKKQTTVSRSIAEAEYRSMCSTACEIKWINYQLNDFKLPVTLPITLFCDNEVAVAIARNLVFHVQTKHIEIDCHIMRNLVSDGFLNVQSISTKKQLADLFTKALPSCKMFPALSQLHFTKLALNEVHCEGSVKC